MDATTNCKNCGNEYPGNFCNICGEKKYTDKDRTLRHVVSEGFHFLTHFEGTFFNTLKAIFLSPGRLSEDYCNGIRKKYFKPLALFLLLVVIYLLLPIFEGLNMKMKYYEQNPVYGKYATAKIAAVMQQSGISYEKLSEVFHHAGEKTSKFLLFIIIPPLALFSFLLAFRKRKYYFDHFIFTIEASSFYILWGFLITPLLFQVFMQATGIYSFSEVPAVISILSVFAIFLTFAGRRFFKFKWWFSILYSILFIAALQFVIMILYKFLLFTIAINMV